MRITLKNNPAVRTVLIACMATLLVGSGCRDVKKVKSYLVQFTTSTGRLIQKKAETLANAANALWKEVWGRDNDNGVEIDPWNRLKGKSKNDLIIKIIHESSGEGKLTFELKLSRPTMHRQAVDSHDWILDESNFPPSLQ